MLLNKEADRTISLSLLEVKQQSCFCSIWLKLSWILL